MKKFIYPFIFVFAILIFASCSRQSATISGCIEGAENTKITLIHQGATTQWLIDSLRTNATGCFQYKIKQTGNSFNPMFVSLAVDDITLATLLIDKNEKIKITATKGNSDYTIDGSEGSILLQKLNNDLQKSNRRFDSLMRLAEVEKNATASAQLNRELGNVYVDQYRAAIRFISQHPKSLACVAALNQQLPNGLSIFSREEDAFRFKMVYDSLSVVYPNSEYVLAIRNEYENRFQYLAMLNKMKVAEELGFVDLILPNVAAEPVALSSLKGNVILLYFWTSANNEQLMFNNELKELYEKYHAKGFSIYQVSLDTDKTVWAKRIKDQQLPWINVCDGFGSASSVFQTYNLKNIPTAFLINKNGDLVASHITTKDIAKKVGEHCR